MEGKRRSLKNEIRRRLCYWDITIKDLVGPETWEDETDPAPGDSVDRKGVETIPIQQGLFTREYV